MASDKYLFTSEAVSMGHPDKLADQISDGILDALFAQDPYSRVACETLVTTGLAMIAGEITTKAMIDYPTVIRNVSNLRVKETDRLAALTRELTKLGASVDETGSGLTVRPPERITPATIETYNDHRMAMSFALAGLRCPGVVIDRPECCAKTFPDFFERFRRLRDGGP